MHINIKFQPTRFYPEHIGLKSIWKTALLKAERWLLYDKFQYGNQCYKEVVRSFADLPGISLEETPNSSKLYPNPAGTNVWLKCSLPINQFVLTDMQGRNMQLNWQLVADGLFLLESKGLSPGNYLITGTGPEGRISCLWQVRKEE